MDDGIGGEAFQAADGVEDWRVVGDGACAFFRIGSFAEAARLVTAIAELDGVREHPPAVDVRADGVTVRLITVEDDYFGMSERDLRVARAISVAARDLGMRSAPSVVQSVLVVPGAADVGEVMPFWQALLGYERRPDSPEEDLVDPRNRGPAFWFETMDELRTDGGGTIHIAVWVPIEEAEARVEAALAAGGRVVRDAFAPAWWTLADAAGNEADVASISHRD